MFNRSILIEFKDMNNTVRRDYLKKATVEDYIALESEMRGMLDIEIGFETRKYGIILSSRILGTEVEF